MKILIVFREGKSDNLFVNTLCKGISDKGIDITCSVDKFWNDNNTFYDIIHFQWPEEIAGWSTQEADIANRFESRVNELKKRGSKFIYTRHNIRPHYSGEITSRIYDIIEQTADTVVHMGNFSKKESEGKLYNARNVVIPHHIYENTYNENITKDQARKELGIDSDKYVITAFGKFRHMDEVKMILSAFVSLDIKNKYLLAPRLLPFSPCTNNKSIVKRIISKLAFVISVPVLKAINISGGSNENIISDEDLPLYIAASDIIMVQRKRILNSGNVPLGFLFGKVVAGPDTGNVGELLRQTGNPVFNPELKESITKAMKEGYKLSASGKGETNRMFAYRNYAIDKITAMDIDEYNLLV